METDKSSYLILDFAMCLILPSSRSLETLLNYLYPIATSLSPGVFGLGDAYGVNIMVSEKVGPDNRRELLYIDYEITGYYSVMLDLAKSFYNDIFSEVLYADNV